MLGGILENAVRQENGIHLINWRKGDNYYFGDYTTLYLYNSRDTIEKSLELISICIKGNYKIKYTKFESFFLY